jgi:hypothetical protein
VREAFGMVAFVGSTGEQMLTAHGAQHFRGGGHEAHDPRVRGRAWVVGGHLGHGFAGASGTDAWTVREPMLSYRCPLAGGGRG